MTIVTNLAPCYTKIVISKKVLLFLGMIILGLAVYLNRAYSHIYSYQQNEVLTNSNMEKRYTLDGGKGQNSFKYVALGDSLTYGLGANSYKGTFPYNLAQKFLDKYKTVEVVNLAVSGAVVEDLVNQLPQAIEEKPDFISILIGTNDVHNFSDIEKFEFSLVSILSQLKENTEAEILLINIPYLGSKDLILPPYNNLLDTKIKEFNQVILKLAKKTNVKHFDLYQSSKTYFEKDSSLYSQDKFHPSDKGYILWGKLINAN